MWILPNSLSQVLTLQNVGCNRDIRYRVGTQPGIRLRRDKELVLLQGVDAGEDDELTASVAPVGDDIGGDVDEHVGIGLDVTPSAAACRWVPGQLEMAVRLHGVADVDWHIWWYCSV